MRSVPNSRATGPYIKLCIIYYRPRECSWPISSSCTPSEAASMELYVGCGVFLTNFFLLYTLWSGVNGAICWLWSVPDQLLPLVHPLKRRQWSYMLVVECSWPTSSSCTPSEAASMELYVGCGVFLTYFFLLYTLWSGVNGAICWLWSVPDQLLPLVHTLKRRRWSYMLVVECSWPTSSSCTPSEAASMELYVGCGVFLTNFFLLYTLWSGVNGAIIYSWLQSEGFHVNFAKDPEYSWFHEHSKSWIHCLLYT